jgi:co-chaperonin GroES (HSP10)
MIETKKLAAELSAKITYTPADDRILVKPMKPVMITKELPAPKSNSLPSNQEELEQLEKEEVKLVKTKVPANMTKGIIIKLGTEYSKLPGDYEVGDIVIFPTYAGVNFELMKDTKMLRKYEIVAFEKGV